MRFQREAITNPIGTFSGIDSNGYPAYVATTPQTARNDFFVNDGSTAGWFALPVGAFDDGSQDNDCVFVQGCEGVDKIFVVANIVAFGAGGLTTVTASIEFQDPDNEQFWIPSREPDFSAVGGVEAPLRTAANANRTWAMAAAGVYILATRVEHKHFAHFRLRLQGDAAPDANTNLRFYWYPGIYKTAW